MLPLDSMGKNQKFLIPCLLQPENRNMYETEPFKSMVLVYSELPKPESGKFLPMARFHKLLSLCSKTPQWKICTHDHLSYTDASFQVQEGMRMALTMQKNSTIRSSVWCLNNRQTDNIIGNLLRLRLQLESNMKKLGIPKTDQFLILCLQWRYGGSDICLVSVVAQIDK